MDTPNLVLVPNNWVWDLKIWLSQAQCVVADLLEHTRMTAIINMGLTSFISRSILSPVNVEGLSYDSYSWQVSFLKLLWPLILFYKIR